MIASFYEYNWNVEQPPKVCTQNNCTAILKCSPFRYSTPQRRFCHPYHPYRHRYRCSLVPYCYHYRGTPPASPPAIPCCTPRTSSGESSVPFSPSRQSRPGQTPRLQMSNWWAMQMKYITTMQCNNTVRKCNIEIAQYNKVGNVISCPRICWYCLPCITK